MDGQRLNALLYLSLLTLTAAYALRRGGRPERLGAVMIVLAVLATMVAGSSGTVMFAQREVRLFVIDLALLVGFVALALRAERFWTLWAASLLALSIELQLAIWIAPVGRLRNVYLLLHALNAYPVLLVLVVGTARHRRRIIMTLPPPVRNAR